MMGRSDVDDFGIDTESPKGGFRSALIDFTMDQVVKESGIGAFICDSSAFGSGRIFRSFVGEDAGAVDSITDHVFVAKCFTGVLNKEVSQVVLHRILQVGVVNNNRCIAKGT